MATPPATEDITVSFRIKRACQMVRAVFLAYREATWSRFCKEVMPPQGQSVAIVIIDDPTKTGRRNGWFCDFPHHLVPDPVIRNAVLTTMSCHDIAFMKKLIEQMFEGTLSRILSEASADHGHTGLDVEIEEVKVRLRPEGPRTVILYENNQTDLNKYDFWLLRITSRTEGTQLACDITGLQFGHKYVAIPWEDHIGVYAKEILAVKSFGTLAEFATEVAKTKGVTGIQYDISARAMEAWHETVDAAMEKKGLSWAALINKPNADYIRHSDKVLRVGRKAIEAWVANQRLTKRRLKAERYDDRHEEERLDEMDALTLKYLEATKEDAEMERSLASLEISK
jgi:hypothetical protein